MFKLLLTRALRRWASAVVIVTPLAFIPLITHVATPEARCGYVALVVVVYWMTAVIPLAVTALLPIALFPLLDILPTNKVTLNYMKDSNVMMMTGVVMAIAIEHCNLHRRIALKILLSVGTSPKWLMFGFMINTAFLSMWLSNTATAAMMTPIVESIVEELNIAYHEEIAHESGVEAPTKILPEITVISPTLNNIKAPIKRRQSVNFGSSKFRTCVLLSIAYSANLGGIGSMSGSGTNLVLVEMLSSLFGGDDFGLTYGTWMLFCIPCLLVALFLAWLWLICYFVGPRTFCQPASEQSRKRIKTLISAHYKSLGSISFHEVMVVVLFTVLLLLWIFRSPEFIPGWQVLFSSPSGIRDSVAGVLIVFLLFVIPSRPDFFCFGLSDVFLDRSPPRLLTWEIVESRMPWGVILLIGGGYALADGFKASGLSTLVANQMLVMRNFPPWSIVTISSIFTAILTEVMSNAAAASVLLPVMAELARSIHIHPLYMMLPVTLCCSMAFMLPVATPSNAIVFRAVNVDTWTTLKPGIIMNILSVGVVLIFINTLGVALFDLNNYPNITVT